MENVVNCNANRNAGAANSVRPQLTAPNRQLSKQAAIQHVALLDENVNLRGALHLNRNKLMITNHLHQHLPKAQDNTKVLHIPTASRPRGLAVDYWHQQHLPAVWLHQP